MKTSVKLAILIIGFAACRNEKAEIFPIEKSTHSNRNARPAASYPDLIIDGFYVNGPITLVGANFKIPLKIVEKNIGTEVAYQDSIYIYQRMPLAGGLYSDRLAGFFIRFNNLDPNLTETIVGDIYIPKKYIHPITRFVHLRSKADGGNRIVELNETNNFSSSIWNVYMPPF